MNTIFEAEVINTQFEENLALTCMDYIDNQTPQKSVQSEDKKDDYNDVELISLSPLILQPTVLEDSNFKNQFFITRSSFQVNDHPFIINQFFLYQKLAHIKLFSDHMQSFNARIWEHGIQKD